MTTFENILLKYKITLIEGSFFSFAKILSPSQKHSIIQVSINAKCQGGDTMNTLLIEDMSKTYLEHSMVIHNFVIKIGSQIKDSLCRVFGDSVQYQWRENDDKVVIPDASIICNMRDRKNVSFTGIPRFVMEVLSDSTEEYDRNEKMQIYCSVGVSEYWIVDWRKKQVEIYMFDWKNDNTAYPYLYKTITENNKDDLQLVMFPNFKITFDELFDIE